MKIKDLIQILKTKDQEKEVLIPHDNEEMYYSNLTRVLEGKYNMEVDGPFYEYKYCDENINGDDVIVLEFEH